MGSGNWIVDNLNSALNMWNGRLAEIWQLLSCSPEDFRGGGVWTVMVGINDALKATGYALLVLFFVMGVVKTCGSFVEMRKPEQVVDIIEDVGFIESIPLWAITLLGSLFIWVLSLVMILTVYSRFFKLYMATAIAPLPLASFAGQPSSSVGVAFLKSYAAICLEGCVIVLACVIFSGFAASPPALADASNAAATHSLELCWRVDLQYAGAGGSCQDERPANSGADGHLRLINKLI